MATFTLTRTVAHPLYNCKTHTHRQTGRQTERREDRKEEENDDDRESAIAIARRWGSNARNATGLDHLSLGTSPTTDDRRLLERLSLEFKCQETHKYAPRRPRCDVLNDECEKRTNALQQQKTTTEKWNLRVDNHHRDWTEIPRPFYVPCRIESSFFSFLNGVHLAWSFVTKKQNCAAA